jgi:hypothetical protein
MGLIPRHTPWRSPKSNGLAKAFFGSFKRDYAYQACLKTMEDVARQLLGWRTLQSPGPAQRLGDAVASRVLCGVVSQKQDSTCSNLGGAVQNAALPNDSACLRKVIPGLSNLLYVN